MLTRCCVVIAALGLVAAPRVGAQAPAVPKPGPEHQKLAYFAGRWTSNGEMKAGPMGPGGKMTGTSTCEWFAGGFHLVCRSQGHGPAGELHGLGILGYSAELKRYTYYGIDNIGSGDPSYGEVKGDTWSWEGDMLMDGQAMRGRYTIKQLSQDGYSWKWEVSGIGGPWTLVMEGTDTRAK